MLAIFCRSPVVVPVLVSVGFLSLYRTKSDHIAKESMASETTLSHQLAAESAAADSLCKEAFVSIQLEKVSFLLSQLKIWKISCWHYVI